MNKKYTLDDYFAKARSRQPVYTRQQAHSLLQSISVSGQVKPNNLISRFFTRKTLNVFGSTLAAAAAVAVFSFTFFDKSNVLTPPSLNPKEGIHAGNNLNNQPPPRHEKKSKEDLAALSALPVEDTSLQSQQEHSFQFTGHDVRGVKILELTPAELEKLGVRKENGGFKFYGLIKTGSPTSVVLTKSKVKIGGVPEPEIRLLTHSEPRIVTDASGSRIISLHADGESGGILNAYYNTMSPAHGENISAFSMVSSQAYPEENQTAESNRRYYQVVYDREKDIYEHVAYVGAEDTTGIKMRMLSKVAPDGKSTLHEIYDYGMDDDELENLPSGGFVFDIPYEEYKIFLFEAHGTQSYGSYEIAQNMLRIYFAGKNPDSSKNAAIQDMIHRFFKQNNTIEISKLRAFIDSIADRTLLGMGYTPDSIDKMQKRSIKNETIAFERNKKNSDLNSGTKIFDTTFVVDKNNNYAEATPDSGNYNIKRRLNRNINNKNENEDIIASSISVVKVNVNSYKQVNKLLPVAVKFDDNTEYILWFDASPEIINNLPERYKNDLQNEYRIAESTDDFCGSKPVAGKDTYFDLWRSCSGAVRNLQVYPNPAKDFVNITYNLAEERAVRISIHDLTGKESKVLSSMQTRRTCTDCKEKFSLNGMAQGMYLLVIETDKGEQTVQRFIVE